MIDTRNVNVIRCFVERVISEMRCDQSMHLFVQTLKSDNQTKLFQATRWLRSFPLLCLCDLRLSQSSGCCSAANASDVLMIAIVELILL